MSHYKPFNVTWTTATNTTNITLYTQQQYKYYPYEPIEQEIVPTEHEDMPILAVRYAGLSIAELSIGGPIKFAAVNRHSTFGRDADAYCIATKRPNWVSHSAPQWGCTCGFYAVPADKLPNHAFNMPLLILQVELSGVIVVHEEGYRAEHQRVLEAIVPPCTICDNPSYVILMHKHDGILNYICEDCYKNVRHGVCDEFGTYNPLYNLPAMARYLDISKTKAMCDVSNSHARLTLSAASRLLGVELSSREI